MTPQEKKFLRKACEYYKVSDWRYLVDRIDVIPISMAVAQSIQECGWGKSLGCLKKNAYFGMTKGKECYQYSTPERSVQAYVRTLNTHKGYKNFRAIRRMMRERNQELLGCILVKELYSYCQDPGYPKIIQYIVKKYRLSVFDLMMENMHRCMVKNNRFRQEDLDFKQYCFHLAKHSEGVKVLAKVLWKKIYKNFSELFSSAA
ncbi:protein bax [Holospora elegans E1]|uniref:Protein bax n=1 Tax=Holospora elegans E1 TaxID=1427503 RepID=A0A023DXE6_9PROT|nr:protein bax [Holospora elegans E1]